MNCPHCKAALPDGAPKCTRCGADFAELDSAMTMGPSGSASETPAPGAAPASAAASGSPQVAAGVLSPPPSGGAAPSGATPGGMSAAASWMTYRALAPGTDFGPRYRIEALLGEGGMGTVYKAIDKELDRPVALKLLRPDLTPDAGAMQRFKQELLLATRVSHKNILRIHDLGDLEGVKFITMAYVDGEDLSHRLRRGGRLPINQALDIARQLCAALEAAHAEGILHRDLKPQNVLMDASGSVYISDFGLAKSLEAGAAAMTRAGEYLGTPRYMSPEQVEGKTLDPRSDLYSLGLIFYEMLTGTTPFAGDSTLQVMYARVKQKPKSPKTLNPEVPEFFEKVVLRCLERDPAQRYQSAREILVDLEGEKATSRGPSVSITLPVSVKRGKLLAIGGAVLALLLLLVVPPVRHLVFRGGGTAETTGIPPLSQGKYLAVMPFRVLGDPQALGYVSEGLVDALSTKLFQLKDVHTSTTASSEKVGEKDSLEKIARQLGANLIVQGSIQGSAQKISVIVHLEDVPGKRRVWSQEFSGVPQDLLTLEDQIYNQLVSALDLKPTGEELARGTARPTDNIEAYDLYLKGRNSMRGSQDINNVKTAIGFYEDAIKKDPNFALAYAGLADSSLTIYRKQKDTFWAQRSLAAAQQALRLNDKLPEVHFSLGNVYNATGKSTEAIAEIKRALELAPNSDEGYRRLGAVYQSRGEKVAAIDSLQKAVQANPYYWLNQNALGAALFSFGENQKALEAFRKVTELEPDNFIGYMNVGNAYLRMGQYNEAIPWYQKALNLKPDGDVYSNLGTAYFFLKRYAESVPLYEKAAEMSPNDMENQSNLGDAYRWAGQKDKANATYEKAIALAYKDLQVNPQNARTLGLLALDYAKKGDAVQAATFIKRARAIDANSVELMYIEGQIAALGGRAEDAVRFLRQAFAKGYPAEEAKNDPELSGLASRPDFQELTKGPGKKGG